VLSANQKGALAESEVVTAAVRLGIPVLKPVAEHGRYDLALEIGGRIYRVQCKWGAMDEAAKVVKVGLRTYCLTFSGERRSVYTADEVDLVAVYCGGNDRCYLLPSSRIDGRTQIWLRLSPPGNSQRASINLAEHYEFAGAVAQLEERRAGSAKVRGSSPLSSTSDSPPAVRTGCHEFRNHFGHYLEQAAAGQEIEISRHGRPYARLVPAQPRLMAA
jgi:prevent-host-death family protein